MDYDDHTHEKGVHVSRGRDELIISLTRRLERAPHESFLRSARKLFNSFLIADIEDAVSNRHLLSAGSIGEGGGGVGGGGWGTISALCCR